MKLFLAFFLFLPGLALANPVENSQWREPGSLECPDFIHFDSGRYLYLNDCYALDRNSVLEEGAYSVQGSSIHLSNRKSYAPINFEYWPQEIKVVEILEISEKKLVLKVGSKVQAFNRVKELPSNNSFKAGRPASPAAP